MLNPPGLSGEPKLVFCIMGQLIHPCSLIDIKIIPSNDFRESLNAQWKLGFHIFSFFLQNYEFYGISTNILEENLSIPKELVTFAKDIHHRG